MADAGPETSGAGSIRRRRLSAQAQAGRRPGSPMASDVEAEDSGGLLLANSKKRPADQGPLFPGEPGKIPLYCDSCVKLL